MICALESRHTICADGGAVQLANGFSTIIVSEGKPHYSAREAVDASVQDNPPPNEVVAAVTMPQEVGPRIVVDATAHRVHAPHGRLARVGLGHAAHSAVWDSQVFRVQATLHANNSLPAAKVRAKEPCVTLRVPQLRKCGNAVGSVVSKSDAVSAQARAQKLTVSTFTRRSPSRSFMALYFFLIVSDFATTPSRAHPRSFMSCAISI